MLLDYGASKSHIWAGCLEHTIDTATIKEQQGICIKSDLEKIKILLNCQKYPIFVLDEALGDAARLQTPTILNLLLTFGASKNLALYAASIFGPISHVRYLLTLDAYLTFTVDEDTPTYTIDYVAPIYGVMWEALWRWEGVMKPRGLIVENREKFFGERMKIIKLLLEEGRGVIQNDDKMVALLEEAEEVGCIGIVELLREYGVDGAGSGDGYDVVEVQDGKCTCNSG
ncbi:hypothetical protein HDV00_006377 [Rhizophlyctis rosea]|nr:hypothetical protein HDV00_006377 [Rhizophlyctis rosea]